MQQNIFFISRLASGTSIQVYFKLMSFLFWFQISVFEADQNPSLRPGAPWKDTILNPEIAQLFFQVQPPVPLFSDLLQTLVRILTKPWRFGNVWGGARSQWEKIQKVSSPGHTGEELLEISPLRGLSHLAKMYKMSSKCANSLPWRGKCHYNSLPGVIGKKRVKKIPHKGVPARCHVHQAVLARKA